MKIKVLAPVLCLALLLTLCFVVPVQAAVMATTTGVVGTSVTISGLNSGTYTIKWDGTQVKQGNLSSAGSVAFTVPASILRSIIFPSP